MRPGVLTELAADRWQSPSEHQREMLEELHADKALLDWLNERLAYLDCQLRDGRYIYVETGHDLRAAIRRAMGAQP